MVVVVQLRKAIFQPNQSTKEDLETEADYTNMKSKSFITILITSVFILGILSSCAGKRESCPSLGKLSSTPVVTLVV
ncbi:MAG: hypothetical protein ACJAZ3_001757 [Sphingobacteriales bacterium]|jgi:hypothetical protein